MSVFSGRVSFYPATGILLLLHALYGRELYFLCDDAYITFRYAKNLALGRGLIWNVGEYVEGYTNFLWTLLMALSIRLDISPEISAPALSVLCTLACLALLLPAARRLAPGFPGTVALIALGLLSLNRSWNVWATGGLETRLFTLLTFAGILALLLAPRAYRPLGGMLMGLAALTRPDGLLIFGMTMIAVAFEERRELWAFTRSRTLPALQSLTAASLPFVAITGAHLAFRLYYYGRPLPNTYYAKVGEPWPEMGFLYVFAFLLEYGLILWILGGGLLLFFARGAVRRSGESADRPRETDPARFYLHLLFILAPHGLYYAYKVGGDHFEYRIFDIYLPFIALFMAHVLCVFWRTAGDRFRRPLAAWTLRVVVIVWALMLYGFIPNWKIFLPAGTPFGFSGVPVEQPDRLARNYFWVPFLRRTFSRWKEAQLKLQHHQIAVRMEAHRDFWNWRTGQMRPFQGMTFPPGSVTEDGGIGILGYFVDIPVIDRLGLTDRTVAEEGLPLSENPDDRMIAHNRRPPPGYMLERGFTMYVHCRVSGLLTDPARIESECPDGYRTLPVDEDTYVGRRGDFYWVFSSPPHFAAATRAWVAETFPPTHIARVRIPDKK